ncbi:MAG: cardiolipin synthase ClsB, partial [Rhodoferax sp.]|nr:cardiolipin synthase ClsB [Rhodoferax sp.]
GIGSPPVPSDWQRRFAQSGVQWHRFAPLGRFGLLIPMRWRRLHRKLCVVDAEVAFCGGINIIDDWFDPVFGPLERPRFDFSVRVRGALVAEVLATMVRFWRRLQLTLQIEHLEFRDARAAWEGQGDSLLRSMEMIDSRPRSGNAGVRAVLVLRDNFRNRTRIERTYRKAIANARNEVLIANAYFLPGRKLRRALVHAAQRGVRVRLLLQGRYEYFMQYHAAKPVILALLNAGVEIHEYRSGFLHAKVAVIDSEWATVGSSNLDPLSLLLAREANIVLEDAAFARQLRDRLQRAMEQDSVAFDVQRHSARPWLQHALDWLAYGSMRLALFLTGSRY